MVGVRGWWWSKCFVTTPGVGPGTREAGSGCGWPSFIWLGCVRPRAGRGAGVRVRAREPRAWRVRAYVCMRMCVCVYVYMYVCMECWPCYRGDEFGCTHPWRPRQCVPWQNAGDDDPREQRRCCEMEQGRSIGVEIRKDGLKHGYEGSYRSLSESFSTSYASFICV